MHAMKVSFRIFLIFFCVAIFSSGAFYLYRYTQNHHTDIGLATVTEKIAEIKDGSDPLVEFGLKESPTQVTLQNNYHTFQTFNNCGPAALSMALSYYGINKSQAELGQQLRPYQNAAGDNDDKSVTLAEVAAKAEEFGLKAYRRPNGKIEHIEQFIANGMPVVARTWLKVDDDIGHFRIVKGYDKERQKLIQDDSLQGKNLQYDYDEFNQIWQKFNYEYLVLVPADKVEIAEQIIGEDVDEQVAWSKAAEHARLELANNPNDVDAGFNLSVALYNAGDFQSSVNEFEKVETKLSRRTLWYQIEPILAYMELKNYDRVMQISDKILNDGNRAFSELYILKGDIYKEQGNIEAARAEYQKAVQFNQSLQVARNRLNSI